MNYLALIEQAPLLRDVDTILTTGDLDYPGTALEVCDPDGNELFHVVVDSSGEQQLLLFGREGTVRLPLDLLDRVIKRSREVVRALPDS